MSRCLTYVSFLYIIEGADSPSPRGQEGSPTSSPQSSGNNTPNNNTNNNNNSTNNLHAIRPVEQPDVDKQMKQNQANQPNNSSQHVHEMAITSTLAVPPPSLSSSLLLLATKTNVILTSRKRNKKRCQWSRNGNKNTMPSRHKLIRPAKNCARRWKIGNDVSTKCTSGM